MPCSTRIFQQAFVHKSVAPLRSQGERKENNERLEYLGDAILEAVVSDILYHRFPEAQEGYLSKLRSNMVCRARLNAISMELGLDKHIIMTSRKDLAISHIPGDALEAFVAAIYLDGGMRRVRKFTLRHIANDRRIAEAQGEMRQDNFKSQLVNLGEQSGIEVFFETHRASSIDDPYNEANFVSEVKLADVVVGRGTGRSKKAAEQMAAQSVLEGIHLGDIDIAKCAHQHDEEIIEQEEEPIPSISLGLPIFEPSVQISETSKAAVLCRPVAPSFELPEADETTQDTASETDIPDVEGVNA